MYISELQPHYTFMDPSGKPWPSFGTSLDA